MNQRMRMRGSAPDYEDAKVPDIETSASIFDRSDTNAGITEHHHTCAAAAASEQSGVTLTSPVKNGEYMPPEVDDTTRQNSVANMLIDAQSQHVQQIIEPLNVLRDDALLKTLNEAFQHGQNIPEYGKIYSFFNVYVLPFLSDY